MLQLLPPNNEIVKSCSFAVNSDSELLTLLELSQGTLDCNGVNYSDTKYVKLLKPHVQLIFDSHEIAQFPQPFIEMETSSGSEPSIGNIIESNSLLEPSNKALG